MLTGVGSSSQHPARVIRCFGWNKFNLSVHWVRHRHNRHRRHVVLLGKGRLALWSVAKLLQQTTKKIKHVHTNLWHIGEPLQNGEDALKVIWHGGVRDSIVVHDLDPSQLVV